MRRLNKTAKVISVVLKLIVVFASFYGVFLHFFNNASSSAILLFTIQSNIWIGTACLIGLILIIKNAEVKKWMYLVKLVLTVSITLTGVVFCVVLDPRGGSNAYDLKSVLTHILTPTVAILDFFVCDYLANYKKRDCLFAAIPPLYYLGFAAIGYISNWDFGGGSNYPYFFLDWGSPAGAFGLLSEPPFMGVVYYVLILAAFVIGVGLLYIWFVGIIKNRSKSVHTDVSP